ncbi:MAG: DUF1045 domain-containing protein [Candidatus Shapirobacteria bacterium]
MNEGKSVINVAFNISNPLHDLIIKISLEIRDEYGSEWYVDDERYFLHYPLYLFAAPKRNEAKITEVAKNFGDILHRVEVESEEVFFNGGGLVMIKFKDNNKTYDYHQKALQLFNPLREGCQRDKYENESYRKTLPSDDQDKLNKYGHIYVLDRYESHITIARVRDLDVCQLLVNKYRKRLIGQKAMIDRLQVHEAVFGPEGKTVLIVDQALKN